MQIALSIGVAVPTAIAIILLYAGLVMASPIIVEHNSYYEVYGKDVDEWWRQLHGRWTGTNWRVDRLPQGGTRLEISHTIPRWIDREDAPSKARKKWDAMMKELARCQRLQGKHAARAAREIAWQSYDSDPDPVIRKWTERSARHVLSPW